MAFEHIFLKNANFIHFICFQEKEYELESMTKDTAGEKETVKVMVMVDDMFLFDNLGFTNTVNTTKYLSCADCDVGPLGYHDLITKIR